jgi:hypothetical protein
MAAGISVSSADRFHSGHHGQARARQTAYRHRLPQWCHHGGGIAADPSEAAGGCNPISTFLTVQGWSARSFEWRPGADNRRNDIQRSPGDGARLTERLRNVRATVTYHVLPVGHSVTSMDGRIAEEWIGQVSPRVA